MSTELYQGFFKDFPVSSRFRTLENITPVGLPFELITRILLFATQAFASDRGWKHIVSPVTLCRVSKDWNTFLSSDPLFWTTIVVRIDEDTREEDVCQSLDIWYQRSGNLPLDIYFQHYGRGDDMTSTSREMIHQALAKSVTRWRVVELIGISGPWLQALVESVAYWMSENVDKEIMYNTDTLSAPLLERLTIHLSRLQTARWLRTLNFKDLPTMRTLRLGGIEQVDVMRVVQHRTTRITDITLSQMQLKDHSPSIVFQWYSLASKITLVDVRGANSPPPPVTHRPLRELQIQSRSCDDLRRILDNLSTPELVKLSIALDDVSEGASSQVIDILTYFIRRSSCKLTHLYIQCSLPKQTALIPFLGTVPSLQTLHLIDTTPGQPSHPMNETLFQLMDSKYGPLYLPSLEVLWYTGAISVGSAQFLESLISRTSVTPSLHAGGITPPKLWDVRIIADQPECTIGDGVASDVVETIRAVGKGTFELLNRDQTKWRFDTGAENERRTV